VRQRLANLDWSFTDDDTAYLAHELHPYPAKFIPQIPANLISALSLRGELVWDPFGGSGTAALEALLLGRRVISSDVNPLATLITEAKCRALSPEQRDLLRALHTRLGALAATSDVEQLLGRAWKNVEQQVPQIPKLDRWFSPTAVRELAYIKGEIGALGDPHAERFASVVLSSIVNSVSNQDGETRYAHRVKALSPGRALQLYSRALADGLAKHGPMEDLLGYRRPTALTLDARSPALPVPADSVDLVVTSPPYANATDYHLYHRFRLFWMGFDPRQMAQAEIGSHLRHQREGRGFELYIADMQPAIKAIATRLRVGRYAVLILGDSVFSGETISTTAALSEVAKELGLEVVGVVSRPVHSTRRSFIAAARRTRSEDLLILRRPATAVGVYFRPAPYRMWEYEDGLRHREIASVLKVEPVEKGDALFAELSPYELDRAQRLAFTHVLEAEGGSPRWRTWQAILENGEVKANRKDPKYCTHGIHPYKGKFYPQLCKSLLNLADLEPGATVLDPFCGSGTVLLEAQLNGHAAIGCDLNPLAVLISRAKTTVPTTSAVVLDYALKEFSDRVALDKSEESDFEFFRPDLRGEIKRWFPLPVASRLGWLLSEVDRVPNSGAQLILRVLLSGIVRQISQQEPADLRVRRRKQLLEDAPVIGLFRARVEEFRKRLLEFGERSSSAPVAFQPATVIEGDSRNPEIFSGLTNKVDCIITSPPYATALPYIDTDRLSILAIQGIESSRRAQLDRDLIGSREVRDRERLALEHSLLSADLENTLGSSTAAEIIRRVSRLNGAKDVGFRRRNMAPLLYRYFDDMHQVVSNLARLVVPGGRVFFVIGDNKTTAGGRLVEIQSGKALAEIGKSVGWELAETIPITVTREALLHSHNSITDNTVLCFRA
jgi:DNA modification methylase